MEIRVKKWANFPILECYEFFNNPLWLGWRKFRKSLSNNLNIKSYNMKFKLIVLFCIILSNNIYSQNVTVETVGLTDPNTNMSADIPKVVDLSGMHSEIVKKINDQIRERFMISSFDQNELESLPWGFVDSHFDIKEKILYIWFSGEYNAASLSHEQDEFYFDLKTGELLSYTIIPFQALFTLNGYLDFINKYWLVGIRNKFKAAIECAEGELPYCDIYDIYSYSVTNNKLNISLPGAEDCYTRFYSYCSPSHNISVELDSLKEYLNESGKYILIKSSYLSKSSIEKYIDNEKLKDRIPNHLFIFGRIDDKYPFSMAINIDNQGKISGCYYYDKKLQKLTLTGQKKGNVISLTETLNNKQTGFFEFKMSDKYDTYDSNEFLLYDQNGNSKYLVGKWVNPEKTKIFDITFTGVKSNEKP